MTGGLRLAAAMVAAGVLLIVAGLLIGRVEAWIARHLAEHRWRRDVEALWREVYRVLDKADARPRSARPLKRRRIAGVRMPRRPMRRTASNSDRRH